MSKISLIIAFFCSIAASLQTNLWAQTLTQDSTRGYTLLHKSKDMYGAGIYDSVIIYGRESIKLLEKQKLYAGSIDAKLEIAAAYIQQIKKQAVNELLDSIAYEIKHLSGKDSIELWTNYYFTLSQWDTRRGYYNQVFEKLLKNEYYAKQLMGRKRLEALSLVYMELGNAYFNTRQPSKSLLYYNEAVSLTIELSGKDNPREAKIYANIGLVYFEQKKFNEAIDYYEKATRIYEKHKETNKMRMGGIYNNMGLAYGEAGDVEKAVFYFQKLLELFRKNNITNDIRIGSTYSNIASVYKDNSIKLDSALFFAHLGLQVRRAALGERHPRLAAFSYDLLGKIHAQLGNLDSAIFYYNSSCTANSYNFTSSAEADIPPTDDCMDFYRTGTFLLHRGYCEAAQYYQTSNKTNVYKARNSFVAAERFFNELVKSGTNENEQIDAIEYLFSPQVELFKSYILHKDYEEAFLLSQRAKSYVLLKAMLSKRTRTFAGIPDSLIKKEEGIQKELAQIQQKLAQKVDSAQEKALRRKNFELEQTQSALLAFYKQNYPSYFNLKYKESSLSIKAIQQKMAKTDVIFDYFFFDDDSLGVFMITPKSFNAKIITFSRPFSEISLGFRNSILYGDSGLFSELGTMLYQKLFPFKVPKSTKRFVIIPNEYLAPVPLEALLRKKPNEKKAALWNMDYAIKKHDFIYNYAFDLLLNRDTTLRYNGQLSAFAPVFSDKDKQYHGEDCRNAIVEADKGTRTDSLRTDKVRSITNQLGLISELRASEREVTEIAALFEARNQKTNIRLFGNASENNFKTDEVAGSEFIHIATHGFANNDNPALSGLLLAEADSTDSEDGILFFGEIYNMKIKARLVCLSACETGLGKLIFGEGVLGVSRAFLYAGAQNLMVSLWKVADESTSELMINFYQQYLNTSIKNNSLAHSLKNAKFNLMKNPQYASPYYWSPFILIGQ